MTQRCPVTAPGVTARWPAATGACRAEWELLSGWCEDESLGMKIVKEDRGQEGLIFTLVGDLDLKGTEELDALVLCMDLGAVERIVVDMTGVDFVATVGWAALLELGDRWRAARSAGAEESMIRLRGLVPRAMASLETAGIEKEFVLER